jgi:hypothetical protein
MVQSAGKTARTLPLRADRFVPVYLRYSPEPFVRPKGLSVIYRTSYDGCKWNFCTLILSVRALARSQNSKKIPAPNNWAG